MNQSALTLLMETITNLGNRIHSVESALVDFMESELPKSSQQWIEMRLRALEDKVKTLEERQAPMVYNKEKQMVQTVADYWNKESEDD